MKLVSAFTYVVLAGILFAGTQPANADNPLLSTLCANVSCLNNFTAKTGWSFSEKEELTGGFTDLEQNWYLSPGPGFDVPIGPGVSVGTPFLDVNAIFKVGKLVSDKIPAVHSMVNSDPFVSGVLGHLTIGESGGYDYTNGKWFDNSWVGAFVTF